MAALLCGLTGARHTGGQLQSSLPSGSEKQTNSDRTPDTSNQGHHTLYTGMTLQIPIPVPSDKNWPEVGSWRPRTMPADDYCWMVGMEGSQGRGVGGALRQ